MELSEPAEEEPITVETKEEDELERLAMEELLKEAKRGAERARDMGAVGWLKNQIPRANKRFLNNTVVSTLRNRDSPSRRKTPRYFPPEVETSRMERRSSKSDRRKSDTSSISVSSRSREKSRHLSSDHGTHTKRHKSKSHKSSKRDSSDKGSPKPKRNHKSSKHEHRKSHRKSKKRKSDRKD